MIKKPEVSKDGKRRAAQQLHRLGAYFLQLVSVRQRWQIRCQDIYPLRANKIHNAQRRLFVLLSIFAFAWCTPKRLGKPEALRLAVYIPTIAARILETE